MLRETKIGLLVACSFLGLLGTVIALKYKGDPLAAEMSAASTPDSSSWLEQPTPVAPENVLPVPQSTPAPGPVVASPPAAPGIQPVSNLNEIKLVSAPGTPKPAVEATMPTPPPAPAIEERRTTPLASEEHSPAVPAAPQVPADSPAVSAAPVSPEQPPVATAPEPTPPSATSSTTPKPSGPLTIPEPEKVIDPLASRATPPNNPGPDNSAPAVAALAGSTMAPSSAVTPAPIVPVAPPAATLGVPAPSPGNGSAETKPASTPPPSTALAAATPPPASSAPAVSPPIPVPAPTTSALIVPQVASFDEETYQCRPGDTIKSIAMQHYHSDKYEQALLAYNRDYPLATENIRRDPANLPAGQPVYIPQVKVLESRYASLIPGLTPLPQPATALATPPAPARAYRVSAAAGEMMRDIAGRSLGNTERWMEIYRMNPKCDPAQPVPAGVVLQMPADAKP